MALQQQIEILSAKRKKKGITLSVLGRQYQKYESGTLPLAKCRTNTFYFYMTKLGLTMSDLNNIMKKS